MPKCLVSRQSLILSEGIQPLSTFFRLVLPAHIIEGMFEQARNELPNECCGLLGGSIEPGGVGRVSARYSLVNVAASSREYLANGPDLFAAHRDMRQRGLEHLAVYHSHPTTEPVPSRTDRERSYGGGVVSLIISLKASTPQMRGWWLTEDSATEALWEMENQG